MVAGWVRGGSGWNFAPHCHVLRLIPCRYQGRSVLRVTLSEILCVVSMTYLYSKTEWGVSHRPVMGPVLIAGIIKGRWLV